MKWLDLTFCPKIIIFKIMSCCMSFVPVFILKNSIHAWLSCSCNLHTIDCDLFHSGLTLLRYQLFYVFIFVWIKHRKVDIGTESILNRKQDAIQESPPIRSGSPAILCKVGDLGTWLLPIMLPQFANPSSRLKTDSVYSFFDKNILFWAFCDACIVFSAFHMKSIVFVLKWKSANWMDGIYSSPSPPPPREQHFIEQW